MGSRKPPFPLLKRGHGICERIGVPVAYVPLDSNNMKLTTAYDVKLAKAVCFLAESERKERRE